MTTLTAMCDAIATDLNAQSLPTHATIKYKRPKDPRVDTGPKLLVYPQHVGYSLLTTTSDYYDQSTIIVEWLEAAFVDAEANQTNQADLTVADTILARLQTYGGGVPGLGVGGATVTASITGAELGDHGDLAWHCKATITVETFA